MTRQYTAVFFSTALLALAGCIVEPSPVAYRTYPGAVTYAPPPVTPDASPFTPPPVPNQEQPEVLTRGPVHEAFAQPVAAQTQPGELVSVQPPANVTETLPADRPAGTCIWAPGYWSWDSERGGYIWVSGCWRVAPPRMNWVPGYWARVPGGWQWVSGFWSPTGAQEIAYLPPPPAAAELQPVLAAPSADDAWVPGCWYWYQGRYVFRSGYWLRQRPGWNWTPSHYVWTPRGHIFVDGHWDHAFEARGMLFAPVCFTRRATLGVSLSFAPSITVDLGLVSASLFACPRYVHYYFGDYYDDSYVRIGIYPWFDCVRVGAWYDPLFAYARWDNHRNRHDEHWEEHARSDYTQRHDDRDLRPPRTYREQEARVARLPEPQRREHQMAQPLRTVVTAPSATARFERVDADAHRRVVQQSEDTHRFREARSDWERVSSPVPTEGKPPVTAPASSPATRVVTRPTTPATPSAPATPATPPAARVTTRPTAPVAPVVTPAAPGTPSRDGRQEIQPDRVQLPAAFNAGRSDTGRGKDREDRGTPDKPSEERGRDHGSKDR